jgi:hypothetical protein
MGRRPRPPLRRSTGTRAELRTVVVYCEGSITEPEYQRAFKRLPSVRRQTSVRIEIAAETAVPYPLVEAAASRAREAEVDEVWCFIDVEAPTPHPRLPEAIALARRADVRLAVSNPCFELWLVLHDRDWNRPGTSTADIVAAAQGLSACSGKHLDADALLSSRHAAVRRARALMRRHLENGMQPPDDNPSSRVGSFIEAYDPECPREERAQAGRPQPH